MNYELSGKPFEYFNGILCVKARYLVSGERADNESLQLIGERGLQKRIERGYIKRVRMPAPNTPMLISFETIPNIWQKILIQAFGNPEKQVRKSLFEKYFEKDLSAYDFFIKHKLNDGSLLPGHIIEEYTLNASVFNCINSTLTG